MGKATVRTPGAPTYIEATLLLFSPSQVRNFMQGYLSHHQRLGNVAGGTTFLAKRQEEIENQKNDDLISRPVHAKMLADIATDPSVDISNISRFTLYDDFIEFLIKREMKKAGRGRILKADDWRSVVCDLAWYLWSEPGRSGVGCRLDELPEELFEPYLPVGEDIESVKRDLLAGSFLDQKMGGIYYFAHRSFQELLVAEHVWNTVCNTSMDNNECVTILGKWATPEVFEFLMERNDTQFVKAIFTRINRFFDREHSLTDCFLPFALFEMFAKYPKIAEISDRKNKVSFSKLDVLIVILNVVHVNGLKKESFGQEAWRSLIESLIDRVEARPFLILCSVLSTILVVSKYLRLDREIIPTIAALLYCRADLDLEGLAEIGVRANRATVLRDVLFSCITAELIDGAEMMMSINVDEVFDELSGIVHLPISDFDRHSLPKSFSLPFSTFFLNWVIDFVLQYANSMRKMLRQLGAVDNRQGLTKIDRRIRHSHLIMRSVSRAWC
jgi:hypothetical protein